ncbi:hypothetical protein E1281_37900 [Actinomadura sp. KC345]|uniref:hypothetical protein n=1 Tax=Actinomadura sp. KC345 TaxID=2530371 RepID=UPI001048D1AB|nr:hypothetical protein [Actinomadura sp. KC345]TDC40930.1 hypothetical protein E1281_37900 [Actinomadura sp. KC345]
MRTTDDDAGGKFKFARGRGQVRLSDTEPDSHLVRGGVIKDGVVVLRLRAAGNPSVDVGTIPNYDFSEKYILKVCLAVDDEGADSFCESSDSHKWPEMDRGKPDPCTGLPSPAAVDNCKNGRDWAGFKGKDKEYKKWKEAIRGPPLLKGSGKAAPARGRRPSINDNPDVKLPKGHAKGAAKVAEPIGRILSWLVWGVYAACVAGVVITGAKMALKHKRGEVGAHGAGLGWVLIACLVPALAAAVIHLLIKPLG